ncbi:MAG TPA: helix-turn-helix transcriptional regulator [Sphingomonadaceae bacterium]
MGKQDLKGEQLLSGLTGKQRQVLDLLIEHKTSKEIARALAISPHTVDQRIQFAKEKLGVRTRSEAAVAYRRLLEACGQPASGATSGQTTYENPDIAAPPPPADEGAGARAPAHESSSRTPIGTGPSPEGQASPPVGRDLFEGRHGTLMRLGAIVAIAVLLVLLVLGALATFSQLSQMMAR